MSDLVITSSVRIPASEIEWTAVRSSGPGGQNVNKVASKVELRFDLEGTTALTFAAKQRLRALAKNRIDPEGRLVITSQATRSQAQNLELAKERLVELIRAALVPPKRRKKTKPSKASQRRRLDDKRKQSEKKRNRGKGFD